MRVLVGVGLAITATLLALWITARGDVPLPVPTPTPTPEASASAKRSACSVADDCYPKPPGSGDGSTGIPAGISLANCGSSATISTPGAVIDACTYTGSLTIAANNVTIRNSRIHGSVRTQGDGSGFRFTVEDSEIGPSSDCGTYEALVGVRNYTARRDYIHGNGDGFRVSGDNVTIEDSFVQTCDLPDDHSDGVQGLAGGSDIVIHHNTIDLRGSTHGPNASVFFADSSESATVTDNLLVSPSSAMKISADADPDIGPWVITGNRVIGSVATTGTECGAVTTTWSDNRTVTIDKDYKITSIGSPVNC
jgi:hypothetical protein